MRSVAPSVSFTVLGEFGVDGLDRRDFGSRKARRLAELLAHGRGRVVPFDSVIEELWGGHPPARPQDQLAVLVSRLRSLLGQETVIRADSGYLLRYNRLDVDDIELLADDADRRIAGGDQAGALVAVRTLLVLLSAGSPVEGESAWDGDQCALINRALVRARHSALAVLLASQRWSDAADIAAAVLDGDPYDEIAVRAQLTAFARAGRVASALSAYQSLRERLIEELGADPSPETRELHGAILRGELTQPPDPQPPQSGRPLVGRDAELAALAAAADLAGTGKVQVLVVDGEAGIGKTSLLKAFASSRVAIGDTVLSGTCRPLDRAVPLDMVLTALGAHLRELGDGAGEILGAEAATVGPLLGATPVRSDLPLLADGMPQPSVLFALIFAILARMAARSRVIVVIDDAHLGGRSISSWTDYLRRRWARLLIVAAVRPGEGQQLSGTGRIDLGPLDRHSAAALVRRTLVGQAQFDELYDRSQGHPLLLTELAGSAESGSIPPTLVAAATGRCEALGAGSATVHTAAVLGGTIDPDLLSGVLQRPLLSVLDDLDQASARRILVEFNGHFMFRHELIREALVVGTPAARRRALQLTAGRLLAGRVGADPVQVAEYARLGGDRLLAAEWLRVAARRAGDRFDFLTAESLLDDAVHLYDGPSVRIDRARLRTMRGRYEEALTDVDSAGGESASTLEVRAWASYFARRFDVAADCADEGAASAAEPTLRARCLMVGGRTRHAAGDLATGEALLNEALGLATGADRIAAAAWLGVIRAHQSRTAEAMALLGRALRPGVEITHTAAGLHALLFSGHVHALDGRPAAAMSAFANYTSEVDRRQVPRFAGRGINFGGWVLRNLGEIERGVDAHLQALEVADSQGTPEVRIAALLDLAENAVTKGDVDLAHIRLTDALAALHGDLVFGWRLNFKARLIRGRLDLLTGNTADALAGADSLAADAEELGVPRYSSVARLLGHLAGVRLGRPVDYVRVEADLDLADNSVAIESWWWAGDLGAALAVPQWIDRGETIAHRMLAQSGSHATGFERHVRNRLDSWRAG